MSTEILLGAGAFLALLIAWVLAPHGHRAQAPMGQATTATR